MSEEIKVTPILQETWDMEAKHSGQIGGPTNKTPKDFFKNEIKVGDAIAFMQVGYRNLCSGTVQKITPKMVMIANKNGDIVARQEFNQVIVKK